MRVVRVRKNRVRIGKLALEDYDGHLGTGYGLSSGM